MEENKRIPVIVIVGAGFGGIELAKKLANKPFEVLVLDKNNYHNFQPLMYQVATGGLGPDSIAFPIRRIFRGASNIKFKIAEVNRVDSVSKIVATSIGDISYDYLVIATGSLTSFFNFEPKKDLFLTLKSIPEALDMRSTIINNIELAANAADNMGEPTPVNVVIIGGGPAGVELAGALAEMRRNVLPKDFPELDFKRMHIYIFEAAPRLLSFMSEKASEKTYKYLKRLGVEVKVSTRVESYDGLKVVTEDGCVIKAKSVIWTAGVKGAAIGGVSASVLLPNGRLKVDACNRVLGESSIFAIGDVAACLTNDTPKGEAMVAQVAIQQGHRLAANFERMRKGLEPIPFHYNNKGVMATIGRRKAVVDLPYIRFQGTFAWFVWMFIHIISLIGFRNKAVTLVNWMINYINYDKPLGLMIRPARFIQRVEKEH